MIKPKERERLMAVLDTCDPASDCAVGNDEIAWARGIIERESKPKRRATRFR